MQVPIDRAGRIVVPKRFRDELGLASGTPLEVEVIDGHLELSPSHQPAQIVPGPHGPVLAATGTSIGEEDVRVILEQTRQRR